MYARPRFHGMDSFRRERSSGSREVPPSDHTDRCVGWSLFICPVRGCRGTGSFRCGVGSERCVGLVFHVNDCGYGGNPATDPGFAYRVNGCGSCHCQSSLLETCCGGCVGRSGSPFEVALSRVMVSTTPIGLPPANNLCGCGRRCWPHGACFR